MSLRRARMLAIDAAIRGGVHRDRTCRIVCL